MSRRFGPQDRAAVISNTAYLLGWQQVSITEDGGACTSGRWWIRYAGVLRIVLLVQGGVLGNTATVIVQRRERTTRQAVRLFRHPVDHGAERWVGPLRDAMPRAAVATIRAAVPELFPADPEDWTPMTWKEPPLRPVGDPTDWLDVSGTNLQDTAHCRLRTPEGSLLGRPFAGWARPGGGFENCVVVRHRADCPEGWTPNA